VLYPPSENPVPLDSENESDAAVITQLREVLGDFFAEKLQGDSDWARGVLGGASVAK
jgi:transcription initiation factor TFIID subunit 6